MPKVKDGETSDTRDTRDKGHKDDNVPHCSTENDLVRSPQSPPDNIRLIEPAFLHKAVRGKGS